MIRERIERALRDWGGADYAELAFAVERDLVNGGFVIIPKDEVKQLRAILLAADHTLSVHGKIDANTPLHEQIAATALTTTEGR